VESLSIPPVPATSEPTTTTAARAQAASNDQPVAGRVTVTAPAVGPGSSTIDGVVLGPGGAVPGATIEADRIVGDASVGTQATSAADGSWKLAGVLGGRYRLRAWKAPTLALTTPQLLFVADGAGLTVTLTLASFTGPQLSVSVAPDPPQVGQPASLAILVTQPVVGATGVVSSPGVADTAVTLIPGANWALSGPASAPTTANGTVLFTVTCLVPGPGGLTASVAGGPAVGLAVQPCVEPPAPPATTGGSSSTSTTVAGSTSVPASLPGGGRSGRPLPGH
jgi:hypothetical protein